MSSSLLGKFKTSIETGNLADGDSIAAYLTSAAGTLLTHTTIGAKEHLDALDAASHLDGSAYAAGVDWLSSMGVVDDNGNWVPLTLNAAGELPVAATVNFAGDYAEDSAHVSGDVGLFTLGVRQDTRASMVDTDGDYSGFQLTANGDLRVRDDDANTTLAAILADTATIDSQTLSIQNTLMALSKAEDAAHSSGDQGIQALAVRKDASGTNTSADGDYASLIAWSNGDLKVVDIANASILQEQVTVTGTAAAVPTTPLTGRKSLMIQNAGSSSIWIGSATVTSAGATTGIEVPKGGFIELESGPAVSVFAISGGGSVAANVLQMA